MLNNMTRGQRIRSARKAKGLTQTELAHKVGIKKHQVIQSYEKDKRGTEHPNIQLLFNISEVLDVSIDWILTGNETNRNNNLNDSNNYPAIQNYALVINWEEINVWNEVRNAMNTAHYEKIPLFGSESKNCFGLRVRDDSMLSGDYNGDSFKAGDIVIVDPDAKVGINDFVVVSLSETELPVLRHFVLSPNGTVLKALNKSYPDQLVTDKVTIYGVVVGQHRSFSKQLREKN